jgi:membrane protein YdbS with pleckstrin-like domain
VSDEQATSVPESSASIADGVLHSLDARFVAHGRLVGGITALVVSSGLLMALIIVLLAVDDMPRFLRVVIPIVTFGAIAALGVFAWRWPVLEHRHSAYRLDRDGIEIRRGVLWRGVANVPRSRIQHTDVSQGPLERNFELSTLHVFTAGTANSEVTLPGLEHERALRIRNHLLTGGEDDSV